MPKQPEDWDPNSDKLPEILHKLHRHLDDAGAAEARAVHGLLFEILDNDLSAEEYLASLDELIGWTEAARKAIAPALRRRPKTVSGEGSFTRQIARATTALNAYSSSWRGSGVDNKKTEMADLLADLMHLAQGEGMDFGVLLERAQRYHEGDAEEESQ